MFLLYLFLGLSSFFLFFVGFSGDGRLSYRGDNLLWLVGGWLVVGRGGVVS